MIDYASLPIYTVPFWNEWGSWYECSISCGGGTRIRRRTCYVPPELPPASYCNGIDEQPDGEPCNPDECPGRHETPLHVLKTTPISQHIAPLNEVLNTLMWGRFDHSNASYHVVNVRNNRSHEWTSCLIDKHITGYLENNWTT